MATYYVDSGAGVVEYSAKTWAVGDRMVPTQADATTNHLIAKQWVWQCTTGGTSTATPAWPASVTDDVTTVTDGGVVWTARAPDNWADAMPGLYWMAADNTTRRLVAADIVYVKNTHNKTYSASTALYLPNSLTNQQPVQLISVSTGLALTVGATEQTSASNQSYQMYGGCGCFGMTFQTGSGSSAGSIEIGARNVSGMDTSSLFSKCTFSSRSNGIIGIGGYSYANGGASLSKFSECVFSATGTNTFINIYEGAVEFSNCSSSGAMTYVFSAANVCNLSSYGCDWSSGTNLVWLSGGANNSSPVCVFSNCKISSSIYSGSTAGVGAEIITLYACSNADHIYNYYLLTGEGVTQSVTAYYLTTGGSQIKDQDGTLVPYSVSITPNSNVSQSFPVYSGWNSKFISATGSKTISVKIAYDSATALKGTECWLEVEYYGDSTSPMSTVEVSAPVVSGTKSRDILAAGTNLTDTGEAWTGTFTNKKTATLSKTVTIAQQGYVRVRVGVAKQQTIYVDQVIGVA